MAEGSLTKALKVIEKEVKDREEFRRVFSNRKVHVFKISVKDITKQCMIEIEARLLADQIELVFSNRKVHVFKISVKDITKQCIVLLCLLRLF